MNRLRMNFLIDSLALALFLLMTSTGFLLKFVLPPGSGRLVGEGNGWGAASKPISLVWGLTRHEWGDIHLWLAISLLVILSIHIFLHWHWIVGILRKQPNEGSGFRFLIGILAAFILLAFMVGPFLAPVRKISRAELLDERQIQDK